MAAPLLRISAHSSREFQLIAVALRQYVDRDLAAGMLDVYLSSTSNRMNEVMKVLTIISTIFIPLNFIAGVYGMNFNTDYRMNMPELDWRFGYPFALTLMFTVAVLLVFYFRKKRWF